MKEFTINEIFNIIDKEAKKLEIEVIIDREMPITLYFAYGPNCMATADARDRSIHIFYDQIERMIEESNEVIEKLGVLGKFTTWYKCPVKNLSSRIRDILIHEKRHIEQYNYLESKGIDVLSYMDKESQKNYWLRPMEIDAYIVQYSRIRLPLKWVLGV